MEGYRRDVQQPVYSALLYYWGFALIAAAPGLSGSLPVGLLALIADIGQLYQLYRLRTVSGRMARAFLMEGIALVLKLGWLAAAALILLTGSADMVPVGLAAITALAGAAAAATADWYLYAGLDEQAAYRGYDYPAGRIRWCFYCMLIAALLSGGVHFAFTPNLDAVFALAARVVSLRLLWTYIRAARRQEQAV